MQNKLVDKIDEEFSEFIEENKMILGFLDDYGHACASCRIYIVFFSLLFW